MAKDVAWDRFTGMLKNYIEEFAASKCMFFGEKTEQVDYEIENFDSLEEDWYSQLLNLDCISEYHEGLKKVAIQYLPIFLNEYPEYKNAECLKVEENKNADK